MTKYVPLRTYKTSTPTHSHPLPPIPTYFHSFVTQYHSFSEQSRQQLLISAHIRSLTSISSVHCLSICLTYLINLRGVILNGANTHFHPLPLTLINPHPFSLVYRPLPFIPTLFQPTPTHVQTTRTHFKPICSLSHPLLVHIQILSPNPSLYLRFQPIFSPCVLDAYTFYVPVYMGLHVSRAHVPT